MNPSSKMKIVLWFGIVLLLCPAWDAVAQSLLKGSRVYVPVYFQIFSSRRGYGAELTATVSVRNTDPRHSIVVHSAKVHNGEGKAVAELLQKPMELGPLAGAQLLVEVPGTTKKEQAGTNPAVVVKWSSKAEVTAPVIQSIMVGTMSQQGISFMCSGVPMRADE